VNIDSDGMVVAHPEQNTANLFSVATCDSKGLNAVQA
jgi:hypothetical protein